MMVLLDLEDGLYEVGQEEREEPRYYPAPWDPRVLLPSVTTILGVLRNPFLQRWRGKLGNEEADRVTKSTSQYGQMVHDYTAIGDMVGGGMEVIGNVDPSMQLQLERYFKWRVEHIAEVVEVEMVVYSRKWLYAGRLDRVFLFKGDSSCSLWDIKTGTVGESHERRPLPMWWAIRSYWGQWWDVGALSISAVRRVRWELRSIAQISAGTLRLLGNYGKFMTGWSRSGRCRDDFR